MSEKYILVVDDFMLICCMIVMCLCECGFVVMEVGDGIVVLEVVCMFVQGSYYFVIIDQVMLLMDGLIFICVLCILLVYVDILIFMLIIEVDSIICDQVCVVGVMGFLFKLFDLDGLIDLVMQLFEWYVQIYGFVLMY